MASIKRFFRRMLRSDNESSDTPDSSNTPKAWNTHKLFNFIRARKARKTLKSAEKAWTSFSSSQLSKLPPELLQEIVSYLPQPSGIALSLACKHLRSSFGENYHTLQNPSYDDKYELLELLARDLPDQVACAICRGLHTMKNFNTYGRNDRSWITKAATKCMRYDAGASLHLISPLIGTAMFKLAMKQVQERPGCTELLSKFSTKAPRVAAGLSCTHVSTERCVVKDGSLMHRLIRVYIPSRSTETKSAVFEDAHGVLRGICPHHSHGYYYGYYRRVKKEYSRSNLITCNECFTEYIFDVKYHPEYGPVGVLTRWKNLGSGPDSDAWEKHILGLMTNFPAMRALMFRRYLGPESLEQSGVPNWNLASAFDDDEGGDDLESLIELAHRKRIK